ncbi:hypothetical protein OSTOST_08081 [Ostertagia ostertagi]
MWLVLILLSFLLVNTGAQDKKYRRCGNLKELEIVFLSFFWKAHPSLYWDTSLVKKAGQALWMRKVNVPHTISFRTGRYYGKSKKSTIQKLRETVGGFKRYFPQIERLPTWAPFGCNCKSDINETFQDMLCYFQTKLPDLGWMWKE